MINWLHGKDTGWVIHVWFWSVEERMRAQQLRDQREHQSGMSAAQELQASENTRIEIFLSKHVPCKPPHFKVLLHDVTTALRGAGRHQNPSYYLCKAEYLH